MAPLDDSNIAESPLTEDGCTTEASGKIRLPPAEFQFLIESELEYLRKAARRWCREPASAEDLAHDTVVQALANAHQWECGSSLRAWLFTIMRNQFFACNARLRRSVEALDAIAEAKFSARATPDLRLVIWDVERAMARLPAAQRAAILLIGVDGKSYDEAALFMGMSVAAVRCHLSRGRERLKAIVHGEEPRWPTRRAAARTGCAVPAPATT